MSIPPRYFCTNCRQRFHITYQGRGWDSICGHCISLLELRPPEGREFWPVSDRPS